MRIQLKRSSVLEGGVAKAPTSAQTEHGELCVNFNADDPALFLKDSANNVVRIAGAGAPGKIDGVTGEAPIVVEEVDENNVVIKFTDAPNDGNQYTRGSQAWNLLETYVKTISGVSPIVVDSSNPQEIQLSFDDAPTDGEQYVRKDGGWELVDVPPGTIVSEGFPTSAIEGQLWWADTDTDKGGGRLYIYVDSQWIDTSMPGGAAISETEADARYVHKNLSNTQVISGPLQLDDTLTATNGITGDLTGNADTATSSTTASQANQVRVSADSTNTTRYLNFSATPNGDYRDSYGNTDLTYNPNSNTITCDNFDGNATTASTAALATNATTASNADRINRQGITSSSSDSYRVLLGVNSNNPGYSNAYVVTDEARLYYNPSTNALNGCATFGGNAVTATTAANCSRTITAGNGLIGGGAMTASRTISVGSGSGITVSADSVSVDSTVIRTTGDQTMSGNKSFSSVLSLNSGNGAEFRSRSTIVSPNTSSKASANGVWITQNTVIGYGNSNVGGTFGNTNNSTNYTSVISFVNGASPDCGKIQCKKDAEPRFAATSDRRIKSDIRDAESMIDKFEQIQVRRFTKTDPHTPDEPSYNVLGFIADELQQVFPDAVEGEPNATMTMGNIVNADGVIVETDVEDPTTSGYVLEEGQVFVAARSEVPKLQTVGEGSLLVPMVKAVQELIAQNKELKARIESLEGGNN